MSSPPSVSRHGLPAADREARGNVRTQARATALAIRQFVTEGVASGQFKPGDKLPTEIELMEQFAGGRTIVRKTLASLESEGLIVRQVGSGTFIAEGTGPVRETARESIFRQAVSDIAELASPQEIMEFRLMIEPAAMELVTRRANQTDIDRMQRCLVESANAADLATFEHWDCELHNTFGRCVRNVLFERAYEMTSASRQRAEWGRLKERTLTPEQRQMHMVEHERIVAAIRDRDPELARREMTEHLEKINRNMFG